MWVVREGYEGLVRGNSQEQGEPVNEAATTAESYAEAEKNEASLIGESKPRRKAHENLLDNLRFGDGDLLKNGTGEHISGRTLKGRYIVRVGWDDVHGWFSQVRQSVLKIFFLFF